jgi:hypothetical protein
VDGDASDVAVMQLDFPTMQPGPYRKSERLHTVADRASAPDRACRAIKRRERTVAGRFDPGATKPLDFSEHEGVVIMRSARQRRSPRLAASPVELTMSVNSTVASTLSKGTCGKRPVRNSSTASSNATLSGANGM